MASAVIFAGNVRVGAVVSTTLTLKLLLLVLFDVSLALQLTKVLPRPKTLPEAGAQVTGLMPSILSSALAT